MPATITKPVKTKKPKLIPVKARQALAEVKQLAKTIHDGITLSNAVFSQETGIVAKLFTTRAERDAFIQTPEYRAIQTLIDSKPKPAVAGPAPTASGVFNLRLPKSLHEALSREAEREGVSLNQLCVAKLSASLSTILS